MYQSYFWSVLMKNYRKPYHLAKIQGRSSKKRDSSVPLKHHGAKPVDTKKIRSLVGNVMSFEYNSPTATISNPTIIQVRRNYSRVFKVGTDFYMAGISLDKAKADKIPPKVLGVLGKTKFLGYRSVYTVSRYLKRSYRVYNLKYIKNLTIINPNIYFDTWF